MTVTLAELRTMISDEEFPTALSQLGPVAIRRLRAALYRGVIEIRREKDGYALRESDTGVTYYLRRSRPA